MDIKENTAIKWPDTFQTEMISWFDKVSTIKKPLIGAINGFCIGGGSELALSLDILLAGENAKFS